MGRTHWYHCPKCHTWYDDLTTQYELGYECSKDGGRLFYDLNQDGCVGKEDCWLQSREEG